jgi:hypothetical protein
MKQVAVVLAALLTLMLVSPAFAQPFADVPTDHWAYDAIAELAAKGLIEGYPDGAFRGDRAMTRYEMAMVVARLLARIEAIKIPPLPPDLVRRPELAKAQAADAAARAAITKKLAIVQRLVAEFRAELAALGVRVTAVEEELAAIRGRLDNTKVTGDMRFRYNAYPTGSVSGSGTFRSPDLRLRARLTFTGSVGPQTTAVVRLLANNLAGNTGSLADTRFGNDGLWNSVSFDLLYLDIRNTYYAKLWRVGRQYYTVAPYGPWGTGLLFDPPGSTGAMGNLPGVWLVTPGTIDGLRSDWGLGPFNVELGLFRQTNAPAVPGLGTFSTVYWDFRTLRVTTSSLLPGWTLGGQYYQQGVVSVSAPGTWAGGNGWGIDISGRLSPGITLYVDYTSWVSIYQPGATFTSGSSPAWRVGGNINLATIAGMSTWNPNIDWEYHNFGPLATGALTPFYTYAGTVFGQAFAYNMRGYLVKLNLTLSPRTSAFIQYEGGTVISTGTAYSEWWARLTHTLAPRTTLYFQYTRGTNVADYFNFYRAELSYSW